MEEVKNKKFQNTKRILKWFGFFLCVLFFAALFYFQFPWKLILAFVLLVGFDSLFPKRYKKWKALFYWAFLLGIIVWILLPDQEEGWRPYIFYDAIVRHDQERFVPDQENAAVVYAQLFDSIDTEEFINDITWVDKTLLKTFWTTDNYPEAARLLNKYSAVTDRLHDACKFEKCSFKLIGNTFEYPESLHDLVMFWYGTYNQAHFLWQAGKLDIISANNDVAHNKLPSAFKKYLSGLRLAQHLRQQPDLNQVLIGISLERTIFSCFHQLLTCQEINSSELDKIKDAISCIFYNPHEDLCIIYERDKLITQNYICAMFYQMNSSGDVRYNRDPESRMSAQIHLDFSTNREPDVFQPWLNRHPKVNHYLQRKTTKALVLLTCLFFPGSPEEAGDIISQAIGDYDETKMMNPRRRQELVDLKKIQINLPYLSRVMFHGFIASPYDRLNELYLGSQAIQQATQVLLVLQEHKNETGHWPESLDIIADRVPEGTLIDHTNSSEFVYYIEGNNFVFYSKGINGLDEYEELLRQAADPNVIDYSQTRPDDIAIWPQIND